MKDGTDPMRRICKGYDETIDHSVSGCPELVKARYIQRHNKTAHIRKHVNTTTSKVSDKLYDQEPGRVTYK